MISKTLHRIADEVVQQVEVTRLYAKAAAMDRHQVELMAICTSHFLGHATELHAAAFTAEALEKALAAACASADSYRESLHDVLDEEPPLPADGRPCNTDVFLARLLDQSIDKWHTIEAIRDWIEGDWAGAMEGITL